jgi:hypothetical protein
MADIIQLRRDTAADWTAAATVLLDGEIGIETDTNTFKVGDGSTAWASLSYYTGSISLDILDNVTITSNASGEILKWNGSAWINQTLSEAGIATAAQGTLANSAQQPPSEGAFADGDKTKLDGAIQNGLIAAKGDLIGASANDTPLILSVGANDFVLTADSAEASGMKWAEISGSTERMVVTDRRAAGGDGGTATAGAWTQREINTEEHNSIVGASLATDTVTLPAGTYSIRGFAVLYGNCRRAHNRLEFAASGTIISSSAYASSYGQVHTTVFNDVITLAAEDTFDLEYYVATTVATYGVGIGADTAEDDIYSTIEITKL